MYVGAHGILVNNTMHVHTKCMESMLACSVICMMSMYATILHGGNTGIHVQWYLLRISDDAPNQNASRNSQSWQSCVLASSKLETASPFRRGRSKSIDDVHRQMVKSYISHVGAPRTDFPDPKVSLVVVWLRACLRRLGRGSVDYSLLVFHKNNRFRKNVKRAVKSKYPLKYFFL